MNDRVSASAPSGVRGRASFVAALILVIAACATPLSDADRAAAALYAQAADTADQQIHANDHMLDATAGGEQDYRDFYHRWAEIEGTFVGSVRGLGFGPTLRADLDKVVTTYEAVRAVLQRLEADPHDTWGPTRGELHKATADAIQASNELRAKVGLPSAGADEHVGPS
jgi:hypothetical protein